jgi:hypothetical protein
LLRNIKMLIMNLLRKFLFLIPLILVTGTMNAQDKSIMEEETIFKVFPNPNHADAETYVSLQGFKSQDLLVVVYDMFGREIYSKVEVRENEGYLFSISSNGNTLAAGVYLIIASANDKVFHQKLIVK